MDFHFSLQGIRKLIINPAEYWELTGKEETSSSHIRNSVLIPFAIIIAIFGFTGSIIFTNSHLQPVYSFLFSIQCFVVILAAVFLTVYILKKAAGFSGISLAYNRAFELIVISLVPFFLCQILSKLFESFQFVNILSLYGLNIFWIGQEQLIKTVEKQKLTLLIISFISFLFLYLITDSVAGFITDRLYFGIIA
jgi:hypothetical protein